MNDKLHDALDKLAPEISEAGVWEELQSRVTVRRRRNRIVQGMLGAVAVLAIGLGASSLLGGTSDPDFAEETTSTTVEATTTTVAGTTTTKVETTSTTVVNSPINPIDVSTVDGPAWAVYFFLGREITQQEAQDVRVALGQMGITRANGLLVEADLTCDLGAAEALQLSELAQFIAVYFASEGDARDFSRDASIPTLAVAEVEHICSPDARLTPWRPAATNVLGPLSPSYTIENFVTVYGELGLGETAFVQDEIPSILEESYFETEITLSPGLNEIEVRIVKLGDAETLHTLEITYLPNATRQFAYIREFAGEMIVDYAEFLTGEEANEAAREAGEIGEGETVPNDFFISNVNPAARGLALAEDAIIYVLGFDEEGGIKPVLVERSDFESMFEGNFDPTDWYGGDPRQLPYWLIIEGETVVQVEQQYLP